MPTSQESQLEFLKLKVFLYKFTPEFERTASAETKEKALAKFDRYKVFLDQKHFWKFDITDFVSSYSFDQDINANTFNWSINLQDGFLTFADIDERLRVEGPKLSDDVDACARLAQYEVQAKDFAADQNRIVQAKQRRGITQPALTVKVGDNLPTQNGLLLSDLIQMYDVVSCFLYKNNTPLEELKGSIQPSTSTFNLDTFKLSDKKTGFVDRFKSTFKGGRSLTSKDLQKESILLSDVNGKSLFSNEFNGFVIQKSMRVSTGGVNVVNISGQGITRLFGSTRRLLKSSLFQKSIYEIGELIDPDKATPFQNNYVGKTVSEIFADLFDIVYRVSFPKQKTIGIFNSFSGVAGTAQIVTGVELSDFNFYDLSSIIVRNDLQTNMFTLPPFLLAQVMLRRGFNFRAPKNTISEQELLARARQEAIRKDAQGNEVINQNTVTRVLDTSGNEQDTITSDQSPVFFSTELESLIPYFKLLREVFRDFSPELRTPFEIIDEIKAKTFLEFYERNDGVIIIRQPQYNDTTNTVFSSDLEIQSSNYRERIDGLASRQKVGWGFDIVEQVSSFREYSYGNGKLLIQYGFMESGADINPNVKNEKYQDKDLTRFKDRGLGRYAQYFLRLHNAALKTATITANLDPKIRVGVTFFDEKLHKFGYVTSVTKSVAVADRATMTFELSYVRDAFLADTKRIETTTLVDGVSRKTGQFIDITRTSKRDAQFIDFEPLERIVDIAQDLTADSVDDSAIDPEPELLKFTSQAEEDE